MKSHEDLVRKAVICVGSQTALAAGINELRPSRASDPDASQSTVSKWARGATKEVGHGNALYIDILTGGFVAYSDFYPLHSTVFDRVETPSSRDRRKAARIRWNQHIKAKAAAVEKRAARERAAQDRVAQKAAA